LVGAALVIFAVTYKPSVLNHAPQGLADHVLTGLAVVKHMAGAIPGIGVVAVRLYCLTGVTAEAYCRVPR